MGLHSNPEVFGFIAAALTTTAFLPTVTETWRTRQVDDIPVLMLLMFITGLLFWVIYAIEINSLSVLIANIFTLILNLIILILKFVFKQQSTSI